MGEKMTLEEYNQRRYELDRDFAEGYLTLKEYREKCNALDLEWDLGHAANGEERPS